MKSKFIFSYIDKDSNGIYRDMTSDKALGIIDFWPSHKMFKGKYANTIKKALLSRYFQNSFIGEFFQDLFANLNAYPYERNTNYYVLIPSTSVGKLSIAYLERFTKRHSNVKLFPVLTDSMHASSPHMDYVRHKLNSKAWERVLTFDKNDAKEFGFTWFGYSWYSSFDEVEASSKISDIFYVGFKKGNREEIIADIYDAAIERKIDCDFRVVSTNEFAVKPGSGLSFVNRKFSYPEIVSSIKSTNVILEVLQDGQDTQTIKYYEAICYGKKLLTNNRHIKELPYYNEERMKYFESINDIDWDWIKKRDSVEYNYQGEFSPLKIVDFLKELYNI